MGTNSVPIYPFAGGNPRRRHGWRLSIGLLAATLGLALPLTTVSAGWSQQQELTASDGAAGDQFGAASAISADGMTALIGACGSPVFFGFCTGTQGAAYVFTRSGSTWSQQTKLTASDGASNDAFGRSVSLSADGSTALIGAFNKNSFAGAAYVFTRSGTSWSQQAELNASGTNSFGISVSLSGDGNTALVASQGNEAAYVFTRTGTAWSQQQKLTASDGASGDGFARWVSLSGDGNTALIGTPFQNSATGSAYVFIRSGAVWSQQQKLTAGDGLAGDEFGMSVSLSGDGGTALVGANFKNTGTGAAYVFTRSGVSWSQQQELTANDGASFDLFGVASLNGDGTTAFIGAPGKNSFTGAAYVFNKNGSGCASAWSQQQ